MDSALPNHPLLRLASVLQGTAYGCHQPVVLAELSLPNNARPDWPAIDEAVSGILGEPLAAGEQADDAPLLRGFAQRALRLALHVQQRAGLAVFETGRMLGARRKSPEEFTVLLATPYAPRYPREAFAALLWASQTLLRLVAALAYPQAADEARSELAILDERLARCRPGDTNSLRFLRAAHEAKIPWDWVAGPWIQFGWGRNQCALNSSILDTTASMGVQLARDKVMCAQILRRAGLPVPAHGLAGSLDQARAIAERLGYPVVIKPPALDGGVGVAAGLGSAADLDHAWSETARHGAQVLVEKHQPGEDYRLLVFDGRMVWAVGRQPAGVTGDGEQTVEALVNLANQDPRRGYQANASLRPLILDEEALSLLAAQELARQGVPEAGRFVRLRRAANISSGGMPLVVTDRVHADNRELVERAVNLLRLDLAGVDLIIPDISRSWRETGAAIIEINAQPQLVAASQTHLYRQILASRAPHGGRIPVAVVIGTGGAHAVALQVLHNLKHGAAKVGLASRQGLWLGHRLIGREGLTPFEAGRALLAQHDTAALLLVIDDASVIRSGLPVDRFDLLVLPGSDAAAEAAVDWLPRMLALSVPHCTGGIIGTSENALSLCRQRGLQLPLDALAASDLGGLVARLTAWFERQLAPVAS